MDTLLKTYVVSDIHTDISLNYQWIKEALANVQERQFFAILIVAGDVTHQEDILLDTFRMLSKCFDVVLFTPGNHDVWATESSSILETSLEKHHCIRSSLEVLSNVYCRPVSVEVREICTGSEQTLWRGAYVPILAWHDEQFDHENEVPSSEIAGKRFPSLNEVVSDRSRAIFRGLELMRDKERQDAATEDQNDMVKSLEEQYDDLLHMFNIDVRSQNRIENWDSSLISWKLDQLNVDEPSTFKKPLRRMSKVPGFILHVTDEAAAFARVFEGVMDMSFLLESFDTIITYSHFLPFPFLNPEKRYLFYPLLAKVIGSKRLGMRLLQVLPDIHIFGHTHFAWNATLQELLSGQGCSANQVEVKVKPLYRKILQCRFLQLPLGYPRERQIRLQSMAVGNFNCGESSRQLGSAFSLKRDLTLNINGDKAHWSEHYKIRKRDGTDTRLASYVKQIYLHI